MTSIFLAIFFLCMAIYGNEHNAPIGYLLLEIGLLAPLIIAAVAMAK